MSERFFGKRNKQQPEMKPIEPATPEQVEPVNTNALQSFAAEKEQDGDAIEADAETTGEPVDREELKNRITDAIRTIYDPEIPVNIYELGLIYEINPQDSGIVHVKMTLTSPNCPAAGILPGEVESRTRGVEGVKDCELELTFDLPWSPDLMSEAAKLELGMM